MKRRLLAALLAAAWTAPALAGPPYDTDDPAPTELHHWETYQFAAGAADRGNFDGATGLDLNYGALPGVQLTATLPVGLSRAEGGPLRAGAGDVELGIKYRFYRDERAGVSLAVFPRVILPTGGADFGGTRARLLLPVWAEKDSGKWSLFGGGGYELNPGAGNSDFWVTGVAVTREVAKGLTIGAELFHQGPDAVGGHPETRLGAGAVAALGGPFSLLLSGGPTFSGGRTGAHGYAALGLNF